MSWTTPSACARVDVTKHVSSSGSLAIVLVANSEVDYGQAYDDDGANGAAVSAQFELIIRCSGKKNSARRMLLFDQAQPWLCKHET